MRCVLAMALVVVLGGCEAKTAPSESDQITGATENLDVAEAGLNNAREKFDSINDGIAWLQTHQAENPAKMQRLINECSVATGAVMEGEGALTITHCIQGRWDAGAPHYGNTPDYHPPALHPQMTRDEQIHALMESDPSSYGYTDADREFLREHGVSEAEARAIEDTLARQGYND